ncbi:hypothetical protein LNTAR_05076 [Lentisphaera araneosa HTCC2155]|uniref:Uncharacterized protein n=1 Tax=Lentisphaera araneosa HTCC2155 TaxID=313628 RepID=A6DLK2_9BACT|nr:hypothetical protein LNTAR_05076 [Lentisphaera araneosa HTCC2155]
MADFSDLIWASLSQKSKKSVEDKFIQ